MNECLTFDDLLIVPQYSDIDSRSEVSLASWYNELPLELPILSSPMDTVTGAEMAKAMSDRGALGVVHRFMSISDQVDLVCDLEYNQDVPCVAAVGVSEDEYNRVVALWDNGVRDFCIDVAHGHHKNVAKMLDFILGRAGEGEAFIIAGSIATARGYEFLAENGADVVRAGIGAGSICSTRTTTSVGVPMASMLMEIEAYRQDTCCDVKVLADGGFRNAGTIVKALALGADYVMLGSMLAGTEEAPGNVFTAPDNKQYKVYRGMASQAASEAHRGVAKSIEGISTTIPFKGPVGAILDDIAANMRSGLSYVGARTLDELRENAVFIRQTEASRVEGFTHILLR